MKVGGSLSLEGMLSSVLMVWACNRVSGYPSLGKKFEISMLKDAMIANLTGCGGVDPHNLITSTFSK